MNDAARDVIARFNLEPLPQEGGYFRRTWSNATSSAILFLVAGDEFSALHRLSHDEVWHFHAGDGVEHVQLDPRNGAVRCVRLGADLMTGDKPQVVVPAGVWQGARLAALAGKQPGAGWALVGCTVSPPWDDDCFQLADRAELLRAFPSHAELIRSLTR